MIPTKCRTTRERITFDGRSLRSYRLRYILRARRFVEKDHNRINELAGRLLDIGAYKGNSNAGGDLRAVRFSILRMWSRDDGYLKNPFGWYRWTSEHGWASYTWLPITDAVEARAS